MEVGLLTPYAKVSARSYASTQTTGAQTAVRRNGGAN